MCGMALEHLTGSDDDYSVVSNTTLEINVYEVIRLNSEPIVFKLVGDAPSTAPVFARILVAAKSLVFASRPPTVMGAFVMNPKPLFLKAVLI